MTTPEDINRAIQRAGWRLSGEKAPSQFYPGPEKASVALESIAHSLYAITLMMAQQQQEPL